MIGARIKQARLLACMTQQELADELRGQGYPITKQAISKYENGKSFPSAQCILLASAVLNVPSTYMTREPTKTVEWIAYRKHSRLPKREREKIQEFARDRAELQIELHRLLYPHSQAALPSPKIVHTLPEAESAAERLRQLWDLGNRPLDCLVQTAEDRGVVVIPWNDTSGKFDGLSGWCDSRPVTVINIDSAPDRRRFSLAHEIGHLVMDTSEVSTKDEERLAHRFAGALLVSAEQAFHELRRRRAGLDWGELKLLKRKYGLSIAAWVRRAYDLDIINERHYRELNIDLSQRGWRKDEPGEYLGDEEPLQLKQMAQHAVSEGLVETEQIAHLDLDIFESKEDVMPRGEYPTAVELLAMDEEERQRWISQMFEWAEDVEFEVFEAYGEEEF